VPFRLALSTHLPAISNGASVTTASRSLNDTRQDIADIRKRDLPGVIAKDLGYPTMLALDRLVMGVCLVGQTGCRQLVR
jgi:hypothetical protein